MEHIAAIMMLVGCSTANTDCREIPGSAIGFETAEECRDVLPPSIRSARKGYKVVYGKCASVDPALYVDDAAISWHITPSNELDVRISFNDPVATAMVTDKGSEVITLNN